MKKKLKIPEVCYNFFMGIKKTPKKWVGVMFTCCNFYGRAYLELKQNQYLARCPKCGKKVRFVIGPGGTDQRLFEIE